MLTFALVFNIVLEGLARAFRTEKGLKDTKIGKEEVKLFVDREHDLTCRKPGRSHRHIDTQTHTHTPIRITDKFNKVIGYKTNAQISFVFLYINTEGSKKKIKKIISFTII